MIQNNDIRFPLSLGSDNHTAVHPRIMSAIAAVNIGCAPSYGTDSVTANAVQVFKRHFGDHIDVHFCFNGTAANVLALAPLFKPHHSILASEHAHINVDECSAPERHLGLKIIPIRNTNGKLTPEQLEPYIVRRGDQHFSQVRGVSITQPTELGTLYSLDEMAAISSFCKKHGLWFHVDGARFANAAERLCVSFETLTKGVDVLSFGGTKNGLLFGEAVLFLSDAARRAAIDFPYIRKQLMQLPSKTRFIAAQFAEYLGTDLWLEIAKNACDRAGELSLGLSRDPRIQITQTVQSNAVFAIIDRPLMKLLRDAAFFYVWNEKTNECRLMTSWSTDTQQIEGFLRLL